MMKTKSLYIAVAFIAFSMAACTNDTPVNGQMDEEAGRIYLSAGMGETVSSRSPYQPTDGSGNVLSSPTTAHPLDVSVWASTTSGTYPDLGLNGSSGEVVAIHTQAFFQSGDPQLLGEAIYPKMPEGSDTPVPVYFIGLHPKSKEGSAWKVVGENKSASYTFTGKEDVMLAPEISGTYGIAYNSSPTFHFYHLLTWLRFEMVADIDESDVLKRETIAKAWGKIKGLTIKSKNGLIIPNVGEITSANLASSVSFDNEMDMSLYQTASNKVFPESVGKDIPTTGIEEVAYVMCAPVNGIYKDTFEKLVSEYTLHVVTEKRELDIPIDLKLNAGTGESSYFKGSTMGKQFTVLLNFKMGNIISVSAAVSLDANTDWYTHGTGSKELTEDILDE